MKFLILFFLIVTNAHGAMLVKNCNNLKEYVVKDPNSKDKHLCFMKVSCDVKRTGTRKKRNLQSKVIPQQKIILSCNAKNSTSCLEPNECLKKNKITVAQRIGFKTEKELEEDAKNKKGNQK